MASVDAIPLSIAELQPERSRNADCAYQLGGIRINSTPTLIRAYAEGAAVEAEAVTDLIQGIEAEASFVPASGGIDVDWWERHRLS